MNRTIAALDLKVARTWEAETDQFVFCLDYLGLSLVTDGDAYCATWVDRMEDRLVYLLESAA